MTTGISRYIDQTIFWGELVGCRKKRLGTVVMSAYESRNRLRPGRSLALWAISLFILTISAGSISVLAAPLTPEEERGKKLYFQGKSTSGEPIFAFVGPSSIKLPAGALPCSNCHGYDGLGRPEGGVEPSNITWRNLTKSYGHRHPDGREHSAFDEDSLTAAIADGIDPAGNALDRAMPRYSMSSEDLEALIAYLRRLGTDFDPGLSETTIKVGSVLPKDGPFRKHGEVAKAVLDAYFDDINGEGGIYGRRIELQVVDYLSDAPSTASAVRRFLETEPVFAVVGAFSIGIERELFPIFERYQVPVIGPLTLFAGHTEFQNDLTFHVQSGLPDQARALIDYAALKLLLKPSATAVILSRDPIYDEIAKAIQTQGDKHDWPAPTVVRFAGGQAEVLEHVVSLKRSGVEAVFYFGPSEALTTFAAKAVELNWTPHLFLSGLLSSSAALNLPPAFDEQTFMAYPTLPSDQTPSGVTMFMKLRERYGLSREYLATQVSVYVAAQVFIEGLRRSGRALSRTNLVAALEGLFSFETGLTFPVSFGPNRRIGTLGAHVVPIDLERHALGSGGQWMRLD